MAVAACLRSWILRETFCRAHKVSHSNTRELLLPRMASSGAKFSVLYCSVLYAPGQGQKEFPPGPTLPVMPKVLLSLCILHLLSPDWTVPSPMPPHFPHKMLTEQKHIFLLAITFTLVPRSCSKSKQGILLQD